MVKEWPVLTERLYSENSIEKTKRSKINDTSLCSHRVTWQRRGGVSRNTLTANPKFRDLTPPPHSGLNVCVFDQKTPIQDSIARAAWGRSRITKKWICRERVYAGSPSVRLKVCTYTRSLESGCFMKVVLYPRRYCTIKCRIKQIGFFSIVHTV